MVNSAEVLNLVNHESGKLWECGIEHSGHINLIIKVDVTGIGLPDTLGEKDIDQIGRYVIFERGEEFITANETEFFETFWDITLDLGLLDGLEDFSEIVIVITLLRLRLLFNVSV